MTKVNECLGRIDAASIGWGVSSVKDVIRRPLRHIRDSVIDALFFALMLPGARSKGRKPFDSKELKLLYRALLSQNLCCTNGQFVPAFETGFASSYGVPYAVASTSGTAAIHVALGALDLSPGDEVITAPITDLGTIIPILYQNAIPVFADTDDTYNLDPSDVERKITPRTRAIIVVHLFGNPCNMNAMMEISKRRGIPLIEDCSQAHLAKYRGRYVGTIGDIGCFSFQQSKQMTTGDGGMTITSNEAYYDRMKLFVDKGYARKGWGPRSYLFHAPNYRMTELVGAVGLAQLEKVRAAIETRSLLGRRMSQLIREIPFVRPAPVTPGGEHSYWLYPIYVERGDIKAVGEALRKEGLPVVVGYTGKPIYLCSESLAAKKTYGSSQWPFTANYPTQIYEYREGLCPRAEETLDHLLCITWDESWTEEDVELTARVIARTIDRLAAAPSLAHAGTITAESTLRDSQSNRSNRVRIGIIGCGQIGRWHLDAYLQNPDCEVIAVADTNFQRAEGFTQKVKARAYRSHKEMIANEALNGASICTVPSTHRDIALDLLDAGVNVLCEKPFAISTAQAEEMLRKSQERNLLLLTAFKFRFHDEVLKAKELVENGSLGRILNFRLMFGGYSDMGGTWYAQRDLAGGGVLMDNGPHAVDLIHYLFGEIENLEGEMVQHQELEVEDTAKLTVRLRSGGVGTADLSWSVAVPAQTYLEIYGENGAVLLDTEGITYRFKTWDKWRRVSNKIDTKGAFARQVAHFVDAIKGRPHLMLNNGEGLKSQIVLDAAYESMRQGTKVHLARYMN